MYIINNSTRLCILTRSHCVYIQDSTVYIIKLLSLCRSPLSENYPLMITLFHLDTKQLTSC